MCHFVDLFSTEDCRDTVLSGIREVNSFNVNIFQKNFLATCY